MKVENVRSHIKDFTLDTAGFEYHNIPSREKLFEDENSIKSTYYEDCIQNIKDITGASRVVIFDHSKSLYAIY